MSKQIPPRIRDRNSDCIHYDQCLSEAAYANKDDVHCKKCKKYKQKVCVFKDYTNSGEDCFDEHTVGN